MDGGVKMKKILSALSMAILFLFGSAGLSSAATFTDVSKDDRFVGHINYLLDEGVIQGFGDQKFGPEQAVTRAAASIMLAKALDLDTSNTNTKFTDVPKSSKAAGAIQSMSEKGIISGFADGHFYPNREVTRAEMAILLAKAFELKEQNYFAFTDVSNTMKSYDAIRKVVTAGIATGYTEKQYRPNEPLTRAQFSAFLARAMSDEFRLETKKPGEKKVTTTEAYTITDQLVADLRKQIVELGEKHQWGSTNPGKVDIAAPVLKAYFTDSIMKRDFKVFIENYYCDCDHDIAPKFEDRMIRFNVSNVTNDSFTVTGLYLTNFIVTEPHFSSILVKVEDGQWKIDEWTEQLVTTEVLDLTKKEVEKAIPGTRVIGEYYSQKAGSTVYELTTDMPDPMMGISKKSGEVIFRD